MRFPPNSRVAALLLFVAAGRLPCADAQTPSAAPAPPPSASPAVPSTPAASPASGYLPPKLLKRAPVGYPEVARLNRVEGVVRVKFSIDDAGSVVNVVVVGSSGSAMLDDAVRDPGMRQWLFQPASLDGKPVPSTREQEFEFRLDPAEQRALALKRLALPYGLPNPPYPETAIPRRLRGQTAIGVFWTKDGLVDRIYLTKSSGFGVLDLTALRFAYENWRIEPSKVTKGVFEKTIDFTRPPFADTLTFESPPKSPK